MPFRPLSFTKNLGGLPVLYRAIRTAYRPGTTMTAFENRLPASVVGKSLLIKQFFLATRIIDEKEYIVEDMLIRYTLGHPWSLTHARLYLFALLLNMPGQRIRSEYQSPSPAQNLFARTVLHDGIGWHNKRLDVDASILPWSRVHVAASGGLKKFCTNLAYFFEQAKFRKLPSGYLHTFADHWGPLAFALFFDRYRISNPTADADDLCRAARNAEIDRLLGIERDWLDAVLDGAALLYSDDNVLTPGFFTNENSEAEAKASTPERVSSVVERLRRSTRNKKSLQMWYDGACQICGVEIFCANGRKSVDYAHVQPLGTPHGGQDTVQNMLSLCPNHHRQLDRGGLTIDPVSLEIIAPFGTAPPSRDKLLLHAHHKLLVSAFTHHRTTIFRP